MPVKDLTQLAAELVAAYDRKNERAGQPVWELEQYLTGFVGDVGDLAKLIMAKQGRRDGPQDLDERLAHELVDCLWSILVLANKLNVELETQFRKEIPQLVARVNGQTQPHM